ncbi:MAG: prepilin-type N-terminal cleavage/methylation domain-containing protein [Victivallaceae bacterium]|nr:prepilin-type N-terminal cleavage/methylation domain-containing protein [Victivallaceae bacterium]
MDLHGYRNRFNLIELMCVVAILGVLAAIVSGAYSYVKSRAKGSDTMVLVAVLDTAFKSGYPSGPPSTDGEWRRLQTRTIAEPLLPPCYLRAGNCEFYGDEFNAALDREFVWRHRENLGTTDWADVKDAWNGDIYVNSDGNFVRIVSAGDDGKFGKNLPVGTGLDSPKDGIWLDDKGLAISDDITNF